MLGKRKKRNSGFTFVELMVVLALFGLVGVVLVSSLTMGFKVWKRSATVNYAYRKAILEFERFSMELRRIYNDPYIPFFAKKNFVSFPNIDKDKILNITYFCSDADKSLKRIVMTRAQMLKGEEGSTRTLVPNLKDCLFSFWAYDPELANFTFLDGERWNYTASGIPPCVKVSFTLDDGTTYEKIIKIPVGQ